MSALQMLSIATTASPAEIDVGERTPAALLVLAAKGEHAPRIQAETILRALSSSLEKHTDLFIPRQLYFDPNEPRIRACEPRAICWARVVLSAESKDASPRFLIVVSLSRLVSEERASIMSIPLADVSDF